MTAGKTIDGGSDTGNLPKTQGADDGIKGNDKKAADKSVAPLTKDEAKELQGDPRTPAQYSF